MQYCVNGQTSYVCWGRDCVIYHYDSGNTHLIQEVPEALIKLCLSESIFGRNDLLRVIKECSEYNERDLHSFVEQLLSLLINKDLIKQLN